MSHLADVACPALTGGLSAYGLNKLARLHGAVVNPRLAKRSVTHVVCTQLSGAKERKALRDASSAHAVAQYVVQPSWITESVAAGRRLPECQFSLMKRISHRFGLNTLATSSFRSKLAKPAKKSCDNATLAVHVLSPDSPDRSRVQEVPFPAVGEKCCNHPDAWSAPSGSPARSELPATALDSEDGTQETELDTDAE